MMRFDSNVHTILDRTTSRGKSLLESWGTTIKGGWVSIFSITLNLFVLRVLNLFLAMWLVFICRFYIEMLHYFSFCFKH